MYCFLMVIICQISSRLEFEGVRERVERPGVLAIEENFNRHFLKNKANIDIIHTLELSKNWSLAT